MPATGDDDLTEVMMEFAQRVQRERKLGTGIPKPFEITSSVVHLGRAEFPGRSQVVRDNPEQQQALAPFDNSFDLYQYSIFHNNDRSTTLGMFLACHDEGRIGAESYIRVNAGQRWIPVVPGFDTGGDIFFVWNLATWTPPPVGQPGTYVQVTIYPQGMSPPQPTQRAAIANFSVHLERASDGTVSDALYGLNNNAFWIWGASGGSSLSFSVAFNY